jgi:hypothetical protein
MNIRVLRAAGDDRRLHGRAALLWCLLVPPSHSHGVPAYRQIALAQQRSIDEGEFGVGGQLPTEPLAPAHVGNVIVRHGKGVFVAPLFTPAEIAVDAVSQKVDMGSVHIAFSELTRTLYERVVAAAEDRTARQHASGCSRPPISSGSTRSSACPAPDASGSTY